MRESFQNLNRRLQEAMAQLIWDQWYVIGGSGSVQRAPIPFAVDIEALVQATHRFCSEEPRIMEQCYDWLALNGKMVNLQRFRNILRDYDLIKGLAIAGLGEFMVERKYYNWKSIISTPTTDRCGADSGFDVPTIRGMSRAPISRLSECTLFKLRSLFGTNARAEVFLWLLTHDFGHAARIAGETQWLPKAVRTILNELDHGGFVFRRPGEKEKVFELYHSEWKKIVHFEQRIQWVNQPPLYQACALLQQMMFEAEKATEFGTDLVALKIRNGIEDLAKLFQEADHSAYFLTWDNYGSGESLVEYFEERATMFVRVALEDRAFTSSHTYQGAD